MKKRKISKETPTTTSTKYITKNAPIFRKYVFSNFNVLQIIFVLLFFSLVASLSLSLSLSRFFSFCHIIKHFKMNKRPSNRYFISNQLNILPRFISHLQRKKTMLATVCLPDSKSLFSVYLRGTLNVNTFATKEQACGV